MFGANLKRLRKNKGLLQADLSALLHVSSQTVSSWEVGRTEPSMGMVDKIAQALDVTPSELIGDVAVVSYSEREMLRKFRALDPTQQQMIIASMDAAYTLTKRQSGDSPAT